MYERFTDRARKVMQLANQEAQRFNHEYIGTEHVLLGLIKEGSGVAANVLKNLDIDLRKIRMEVEKLVQSGPDMVTTEEIDRQLPQDPRLPTLREQLADVSLCVLLDARSDGMEFEQLLTTLLAAGVRMIQIRDKSASDAVLLDRGQRAAAVAQRIAAAAIITVNDRIAVAAAAGIDGVHIGADDLPVPLARQLLGSKQLIGRTAHDLNEARAAAAAGADYLGIGPCYPSTTKAFARQASREFLRSTAAEIPLPIFAIGGITPDRLDELAAIGIQRVAVSAAVTAAADPAAAAGRFLEALSRRTVRR